MGIPFLPDEIFAKILPHLHPDDILKSVSPACQRLHFLATDPLLWRGICVTHFRAFSAEHRFGELLDGPPREVDWLALYRLRKRRNAHALQLLEDMTKSSVLQLDKMDILCAFDYDVKELLIDHAQSDPYQEDGFSRAFWARRALDAIHRRRAVGAWMELRDPARGPEGFYRPSPKVATEGLERGHAAFDMFVLHDSWCDTDWICNQLDNMAESLRKTVPDLASRSTRDQALILNLWLRQLGFNGLSDRSNYRDLRNCLLGQALRHPDHETIPITSATIYCSIARRLGILADPWFNPGHVIVCVWPYPDRTLDGEEAQEGQKLTPMYLDPWGRDGEVPTDEVTPFAVPATWYSRTRKGLTHPVETVLRVHNNIQATNHAAENRFVHFESDLGQLLSGHSQMNLLAAQYASLWARIILADPQEFAFGNLPPYDKLTSLLVDDFPEDVTWAESMLGPMLQSNPELFPPNWKEKLEHAFTVARRRSANGESDDGDWRWDCELASGQVFRHKRNDNIGLIFRAKMPKTLPSTGKADFFECQFADRPNEDFVVAQQNIEIVTDATLVSPEMFPRAGQCFKRFDKEQCRFIPIQSSE